MRVTLSPVERAIVEVTVALANWKKLASPPGHVRRVVRAASARAGLPSPSGPPDPLDLWLFVRSRLRPHLETGPLVHIFDKAEVERTGGVLTVGAYHKQLRHWLSQIALQGHVASTQVAPEVARYLPQSGVWCPMLEDGRIVYKLTINVIPGLLAYGTALILDRNRGLAQRLGQCGHCGRFNLALEGRPRTHCNEAHRLAYDRKMAAERMRAYRQRKRRQQKRGGKGT